MPHCSAPSPSTHVQITAVQEKSHEVLIFSLLPTDSCFATQAVGENRGNNACSVHFQTSKNTLHAYTVCSLSTTELPEGQFSNTGKQGDINGNKGIMSFEYNHFMRHRCHCHSFLQATVITLKSLRADQILTQEYGAMTSLWPSNTCRECINRRGMTAYLGGLW